MGLFGIFDAKPGGAFRKHAERATNKRAQAVDRWESIQFLVREGTASSVEALLPRFAFYVDPSITDQEEKDAAFEGILRVGATAKASVVAYMAKSESLSWPLKLLDRMMSEVDVITVLLELLTPMDIEYERDPQRKIQLLAALEERSSTTIPAIVGRFLRDANETVRFHAVGAVFAQESAAEQRDALLECLCAEESVRVRNRLLENFVQRGWAVGDRVDAVRSHLTPGFAIDARGVLKRTP